MDKPGLDDSFKWYEQAITILEEAIPRPSLEQVVSVLSARDAVSFALLDKSQKSTGYLLDINELDKRLKKHLDLISKINGLSELRTLLNPPAEAWWWPVDSDSKNWSRFDWLWGALTVPWLGSWIK